MDFSQMFGGELTGEYLKAQSDLKFTTELEELIRGTLDFIGQSSTFKDVNLRKTSKTNSYMEKLEELLWNRFGIPFRVIGDDGFAYTVPITGVNSSIIDTYRLDINKELEQHREAMCKSKGKCTYKKVDSSRLDNGKDLWKDSNVIDYLGNGVKTMNEIYGKKGLKIDTNKIHIEGLEHLKKKDQGVIIALSFKMMIEYGKSVREIASIILHEVGHVFNDFMFGNVFTKTALPALNSFMDEKDPSKKVIRSYKTLTGEEATLTDAMKKLPIELTKHVDQQLGSSSSFYNSEIMADTFAAKFGYAEDIVTALNDIYINQERREYPGFQALGVIMIWLAITALYLIALVVFPIWMVFYLFDMIVFTLEVWSLDLLFPNIQDINDVHEQSYTRTRRMKLELIRQLRTKQLPDYKKSFVDMIFRIDQSLQNMEVDKKSVQILYTILRGNSTEVGYHELYQRLEQVSESDLHMLNYKLKTLKKGK